MTIRSLMNCLLQVPVAQRMRLEYAQLQETAQAYLRSGMDALYATVQIDDPQKLSDGYGHLMAQALDHTKYFDARASCLESFLCSSRT